MKRNTFALCLGTRLAFLAGLTTLWPWLLCAQSGWPSPASTAPDAQRNALNNVRAQASWLQNATQTAPNYLTGGYDMVWRQFLALRGAFGSFESTLNPAQLNQGAGDLADLEAGLDFAQEAFDTCQDSVAAGQPANPALRNLCLGLHQTVGVWVQRFNTDSKRLRVEWQGSRNWSGE
jgi:hypothetical protein